jgi:hypothetical protein
MPKDFNSLAAMLHGKSCAHCRKPPAETALCLVCGAILCAGFLCQNNLARHFPSLDDPAFMLHAKMCGAGCGIFYMVHEVRFAGDKLHLARTRPSRNVAIPFVFLFPSHPYLLFYMVHEVRLAGEPHHARTCPTPNVARTFLPFSLSHTSRQCPLTFFPPLPLPPIQGRVLLVGSRQAASCPSIYLDSHGEEDHMLRRGQPLYLSTRRQVAIHRLWLTHAVPVQVGRALDTARAI